MRIENISNMITSVRDRQQLGDSTDVTFVCEEDREHQLHEKISQTQSTARILHY